MKVLSYRKEEPLKKEFRDKAEALKVIAEIGIDGNVVYPFCPIIIGQCRMDCINFNPPHYETKNISIMTKIVFVQPYCDNPNITGVIINE
jgi:hypothetical protein